MKKNKKFYKRKILLKRYREYQESLKSSQSYYYKQRGYTMRVILSKEGNRHPLAEELRELLPIFAHKKYSDTLEFPDFEFGYIKKELYLKLKPTHKMLLVTMIVNDTHDPAFSERVYIINPIYHELFVPHITKHYHKEYDLSRNVLWGELSNDRVEQRIGIWHDEKESDKCGRKAKHKKDLLRLAREEVQDFL